MPAPTFREFFNLVSGTVRGSGDFKKTAGVRVPLMRVAHSTLTDEEAVERMRPIVQDQREAAAATLRHYTELHHRSVGYISDRAYRIMVAAIGNTAPASVSRENVAVFEREKELGRMPLEQVFNRLASLVPELRVMAERASALSPLADGDDSTALAYREVRRGAQKLVGPGSTYADPVVRVGLAPLVVTQYLDALVHAPGARDPQRALWDLQEQAPPTEP